MPEFFNPRYYTLDRLASHRLEYVCLQVDRFIRMFGIRSLEWPLDCTRLLKKIKSLQLIPFTYGFATLSEKCEAITEYDIRHNVYLMLLNRSRIHYPYKSSADMRLNFTLAHEIGHIMLEHLKVPRVLKSNSEIAREEIEANEFAGRLLLPEFLLFTSKFPSLDAAAGYFLVSKTALWMRLNNMKRLDLLFQKKRRFRSCGQCGSVSFSAFAQFCGICGRPLQGGPAGMRQICYPEEIRLDPYRRALSCPLCHSAKTDETGERCGICHTYMFNFCSSYLSDSHSACFHANPGNARFCENCGSETYFSQKKLLPAWQDALDRYFVAEEEAGYGYGYEFATDLGSKAGSL